MDKTPEPVCRCGHGPKNHAARQWVCYICGSDECADYTPQNRYFVPKARVPVNDEAEAEMDDAEAAWLKWVYENADTFNTDRLSFLAGYRQGRSDA